MEIRDFHALLGGTAYAADGDRLGTISGVYLDDATGRPSWMTVESGGLFRTTRSFVPLADAEIVDGGVRAGVDADVVRRAPHVDDDKVLTQADEQELLRHYGLARPQSAGPRHAATGPDPNEPGQEPGREPDSDRPGMIRSEEQVRVGTTTVPSSRAVLRTTRVVEERTFSVPLGRDQVQVVYEPLPDSGPEPATEQPPQGSSRSVSPAGADGDSEDNADNDDWVVLYEERLVVRTEWVPVERVRLRTVGVQGEQVVNVDLRRERIDVVAEPSAQLPAGPVPPEPVPPRQADDRTS
jgi:hypothetical protein